PGLTNCIVGGDKLRSVIDLGAGRVEFRFIATVHNGFPGGSVLGAKEEIMGPAYIGLFIHLEEFGLYGKAVPGTIGQIKGLLTRIMKGYQREDPTPFRVDVIKWNCEYGLGGILVFRTEILPIGSAEGELSRTDD